MTALLSAKSAGATDREIATRSTVREPSKNGKVAHLSVAERAARGKAVTGPDGVKWDFYMRQLWDSKGSAIIEGMKPRELAAYGQICGRTLARAHARSGDAVAIGAYLGSGDALDKALADFAELYADQNELDYAALSAAVKTGKVKAETAL